MANFKKGDKFTLKQVRGVALYEIIQAVTAPKSDNVVGYLVGRVDGTLKPRMYKTTYLEGLLRDGKLIPVAAPDFKVGDILEMTVDGILHCYEIEYVTSDLVIYWRITPTRGEEEIVMNRRALADIVWHGSVIHKALATRTSPFPVFGMTSDGSAHKVKPQSVTPYELKQNDIIARCDVKNGSYCDCIKIERVTDSQVDYTNRAEYVILDKEIAEAKLLSGHWRPATVREIVLYLNSEADRLDEVAANAVEQRARIVEQINALKATQG
jgi:hypothetical protein